MEATLFISSPLLYLPLSPILLHLLCLFSFFCPHLYSTFYFFAGLTSTCFALICFGPLMSSVLWMSFPLSPSPLYLLIFLSSPPSFFLCLPFIFYASSPLHLSSGPNSPITAGRNYAWKLIRRSFNNYPLMQLIDFPFQELSFLSPGSPALSPKLALPYYFIMFWVFFGQAMIEFVGAKTPRKKIQFTTYFSPVIFLLSVIFIGFMCTETFLN